MKKYLLLTALICLTLKFVAQAPANDNCSTATDFSTLANPGACGTGIQSGTATSLVSSNIGATASSPYLSQGSMASMASDVWYKFVCPANGAGCVVTITGATFANPNIGLWGGACGQLAGAGSTVGSAGTATLTANGLTPGQTYYIQISGNVGQTGTFTLSVNAFQNCSYCNNASTLTINPLPVNGTYLPGQTVTFSYHVSTWTEVNTSWLHGVQATFGSGWDLSSLTTVAPARVFAACGSWAYYPSGTTSSGNGTTWPAGFYFEGGNAGCTNDGNPGNNFGDGAGTTAGAVEAPPANGWIFSYTISVKSNCNPGGDLSVIINTSGDGESGGWASAACTNDAATIFNANVADVVATASNGGPYCEGDTLSLTASGGTVYSWMGPYLSVSIQNPTIADVTNGSDGTYTLTATSGSCSSTTTTSVTVHFLPVASIASPSQLTCVSSSIVLNGSGYSYSAASISYAWTTTSGNIVSGITTNTASVNAAGSYTLTVTDSIGCSDTASVTVTLNNTPPVATISAPQQLTCATDTVTLDGSGSTFNMSYSWATANGHIVPGPSGNSASADMPGSYTLTVTNYSNGCSATATATVVSNTTIPNADAGSNQTITCAVPSVTLTGSSSSSGATFSWSPGGTTPTSSSTSVTAGGTYSLTVTDPSNGCVNTSIVTVSADTAAPAIVSVAGNGPLCTGQTLNLSSGTSATSPSYSWAGPNTFSSTAQNPVDTNISVSDGGYYILTVTEGTNGCSATDSVLVTVNANTDITGHLGSASGNVTTGNVFLIVQGTTSALYDTVAVVSPDAGGNYIFAGVSPGNYYIRAEGTTASLVSTYFGNVYLWDSSYIVNHGCANTDTANITLIGVTATSGPGTISGTVYEGVGFGLKIIPGNPTPYANVIPGVPVKVAKNPSGTIVASGNTNAGGVYMFTNLPVDDYIIYVDMPGYPMDSSYTVSVTNTTGNFTGLDYIVDSNSVYIDLTLSAQSNNIALYRAALVAFPNPTQNNATISFDVIEYSNVNFELYNLQGEKIAVLLNRSFDKGNYSQTINFDQYALTNGTYVIKASINNNQRIIRLVVMR